VIVYSHVFIAGEQDSHASGHAPWSLPGPGGAPKDDERRFHQPPSEPAPTQGKARLSLVRQIARRQENTVRSRSRVAVIYDRADTDLKMVPDRGGCIKVRPPRECVGLIGHCVPSCKEKDIDVCVFVESADGLDGVDVKLGLHDATPGSVTAAAA
jgi:hypothetical protein